MTTLEKLTYGAADLVPDTAKAAWGARLIVTQTGDVDLLPDRQDLVGELEDAAKLAAYLNSGVLKKVREFLSEDLKAYRVKTREAEEVTVYEDDVLVARGNSNGSAGYFYITAYMKGDE